MAKLILPETKRVASDVNDTGNSRQRIVIYGTSGVGKTTFASNWPGTLFIATKKGQDYIECYEPAEASNWTDLANIVRGIEDMFVLSKREGKTPTFGDGVKLQTVVLDTLDRAYLQCCEYAATELHVSNVADLEWGKGYKRVEALMLALLNKLDHLPCNVILLAHSAEKGEKKMRYEEIGQLHAACKTQVQQWCDIGLYCDARLTAGADGKAVTKRLLYAQPSGKRWAKDRTNRLPKVAFPMDYETFAAYFANNTEQNSDAD